MTERQQADFERYMYIVPNKIAKYTPEFIGNEDFEQDCYLHLAEYITTNVAFNQLEELHERGQRISSHIAWFVRHHAKKYDNKPLLTVFKTDDDPYKHMRDIEIHNALLMAISHLTEQQQKVLYYRFGFATGKGMTLEEVGNILCKCRARIRQIENKSIRILRNRTYLAGKHIHNAIPHESKTIKLENGEIYHFSNPIYY